MVLNDLLLMLSHAPRFQISTCLIGKGLFYGMLKLIKPVLLGH